MAYIITGYCILHDEHYRTLQTQYDSDVLGCPKCNDEALYKGTKETIEKLGNLWGGYCESRDD